MSTTVPPQLMFAPAGRMSRTSSKSNVKMTYEVHRHHNKNQKQYSRQYLLCHTGLTSVRIAHTSTNGREAYSRRRSKWCGGYAQQNQPP